MRYDKRKLERLDIFLIVEFKPLQNMGGGTTGITRDLTTAGFSMEAQSIDCRSGDILEFRLKQPGSHQELVLSGEVVWKNHSWYKYVIGVKFLEVSKEQRTGILKLMSGVKDVATAAGLSGEDSARVPETEKKEEQAAKEDSVKTDEPGPDTSEMSRSVIDVEATGQGEPKDPEENSIAGDEEEKADIKSSVPDADNVSYDNISSAEEGRNKKVWLYVPLAAIVVVILLIAVPAMIEEFNHTAKNGDVRLSDSERHDSREKIISMPEDDIIQGNDEDVTVPEPAPVQDEERDILIGTDAMEGLSGDISANNKVNEEKIQETGLSEEDQITSEAAQEVNEKEDDKSTP